MESLYFQGRILKLGLKVTVIQTLGKTMYQKVWIFFSAKNTSAQRGTLEQHKLPGQELARYFSRCCDKMPEKSNSSLLHKRGLILPTVWWYYDIMNDIMVGKAWRQEHRAAGHVAIAVKKQRKMGAGVQLVSSFLYILGPHLVEWQYIILTQIIPTWKLPHWHPRDSSFPSF